jgi:hypothetical protein
MLSAQLGELRTILAHTVKATKTMPAKAIRHKDTRSSLTAMVEQYEKFEDKEKRRVTINTQVYNVYIYMYSNRALKSKCV